MSGTASRFAQLSLADAIQVCALILVQVDAMRGSDIATAVESEQAARTFNVRLEQTEMLLQTGCIETGTY